MPISPQKSPFTACDQQHFGVRLEPDNAVHHLHTNRFKLFGPVDVGLFVKTRFQLHHGRDFLATANGLAQQIHHGRVATSPINRLLDRQHIRVHDGFAQKREHAVETLKRLVNHHIARFETCKYRTVLRHLRRKTGGVRRKEQFRRIDQINQLHQADQIHRSIDPENGLLWQLEFFAQKFRQPRCAVGRHLQTHRLTVVPVLQTLAQGHAQIGDFVFVHRQFGVAGDPKLRELPDLATRKQFGQVRPDHAGQHDISGGAITHPGRQRNQARQHAWDFDNRNFIGPTKRVFAGQLNNEIQRLVGHLGKGVRRVQAHRHQQRLDFALKVAAHPLALGGIALTMRQDTVTLALQGGQQILVVQRVLARHHGTGSFGNGGQTFLCVGPRFQTLQTAHHMRLGAHLKKLIQIRRHDAQVAQAFQHRHFRAMRPIEHTLVEGQNAQIPVQQGLPIVCC